MGRKTRATAESPVECDENGTGPSILAQRPMFYNRPLAKAQCGATALFQSFGSSAKLGLEEGGSPAPTLHIITSTTAAFLSAISEAASVASGAASATSEATSVASRVASAISGVTSATNRTASVINGVASGTSEAASATDGTQLVNDEIRFVPDAASFGNDDARFIIIFVFSV